MKINPQYLLARRRSERYAKLELAGPAYGATKRPAPKVRIGSGRYPGQPIELSPAIYTPPRSPRSWIDPALLVVSALAVILSFVFVGW